MTRLIMIFSFWTMAAALHSPVVAADIASEMLNGEMAIITLTGDIEPGDAAKFRNEAAKYSEAVVWLESDGGVTTEAIEIGETIRLKGFGTLVINGENCFSACGLIWLAGSPRAITETAQVGFHATWVEANGQQNESGVGNALVGRYLTLLNLPARAVAFATSAPPDSLNWLTRLNFSEVGIETIVVDDFNFDEVQSENVSPPPIVRTNPAPQAKQEVAETVLYDEVGFWSVYVDYTLAGSCFIAARYEGSTLFRIGLNLQGEEQSYLLVSNPEWTSLRDDQVFDLSFAFSGYEPWTVTTTVSTLGDTKVLVSSFTNDQFWDEFVSAETLRITRNGQLVGFLSLRDSSAAFNRMLDCQKEVHRNAPRDPFAN